MIKLLIADDEPLVLVGMQSMLDWASMGVEICATAHNGQQALELIRRHRPDIVITDIKMPLMTGLEVAAACREEDAELPLFIMLTSYEEFKFVQEAMHFGAVEYLVKLELTPQNLRAVMDKALERLKKMKGAAAAAPFAGVPGEASFSLQVFSEKFYARLYNALFESREQFRRQAEDLGLDFSAPFYAAAACGIADRREMSAEQQFTLYTSTVQMVRDTLEKFGPCTVTSIDPSHFNILFPLTQEQAADAAYLPRLLRTAVDTVHRYFSVRLRCGVGDAVDDPFLLSHSAHRARCLLAGASAEQPVCAAPQDSSVPDSLFDFSLFRADLARAFTELDAPLMHDCVTHIVEQLQGHPELHAQARDAAAALLYLTLTLLPNGQETLHTIFADEPDGYRSIDASTGTAQCCQWMERLRDGLCEQLNSQHKTYKRRIVEDVVEYIRQNLSRRLSLNEVAAAFGFSPNYLSQLFAKYADRGFVETITQEKIAAAKAMMADEELKIYEIAERLGYENAFYFSKVFKKETGLSPREYLQQTR